MQVHMEPRRITPVSALLTSAEISLRVCSAGRRRQGSRFLQIRVQGLGFWIRI